MDSRLKAEIAAKIRLILDKKGWKQQQLADKTGMTKAYISHILAARVNLTIESIGVLEKVLGERIIEIKR